MITLPPNNHSEAGTHHAVMGCSTEWSPLLVLREKEPGGQGETDGELPEVRLWRSECCPAWSA